MTDLRDIFWKKRAIYLGLLDKKENTNNKGTFVGMLPILLDSPFWDYIILTAIDEHQQLFYQHQLDEKLLLNQIPSCCKYMVLSDPPGNKIGCGGATVAALQKLKSSEPNWEKSNRFKINICFSENSYCSCWRLFQTIVKSQHDWKNILPHAPSTPQRYKFKG